MVDINDKQWQKQRKAEWKKVKFSLENNMLQIEKSDIPFLKNFFMTGVFDPESKLYLKYSYTYDLYPEMPEEKLLTGPLPPYSLMTLMWLHPESSSSAWRDELWRKATIEYPERGCYEFQRDFFKATTVKRPFDVEYGCLGGMEKEVLKYAVLSDHYTDDTAMVLGKEVRKIPWRDADDTFLYIFWGIISLFNFNPKVKRFDKIGSECRTYKSYAPNLYSPYQWLHELLVSTFNLISWDNIDIGLENQLQRLLRCLKYPEVYPAQHVEAGMKLIAILEDESTPEELREPWLELRKTEGI